MNLTLQTDFVFIPETDAFLNLFPYRHDYIHAKHGFNAEWRTNTKHALSDRLILQGQQLVGVRFGFMTEYAMLDIDDGSLYHPNHDPFAIGRIMAALEPLGIVAHVPITSSYGGGLHLYLPLPEAFKTWEIAAAIAVLLSGAGFIITPGQLEVFPNRKTSPEQRYAAHRLPLQAGSYLLDADGHPCFTSREEFTHRWQLAGGHNCTEQRLVDQALRTYERRDYRITREAKKFLQDLDADIDVGWTAPGQTNFILGRLALRGYVFGHILESDQPLVGRSLVRYIVDTARQLPGFYDWCRHQSELERRAWEWVRSVEASPRYFHYGWDNGPIVRDAPDSSGGNAWNTLQMQLARLRIQEAIADHLDKGTLPIGARDRMFALKERGISSETLYKHLDLWHPEHLTEPSPLDPSPPNNGKSLLPLIGWINAQGKALSDFTPSELYKIGWIMPDSRAFSLPDGGD